MKQARQDPVIVTYRGKPDVVLVPVEESERLRRLRAYFRMVAISRELATLGLTASELHESSWRELEERAWS